MTDVSVVRSEVKSLSIDTFPLLLEEHARTRGDSPAYREKHSGIWKEHSWSNVASQVKLFALGMASLGFKRGDNLMIVGDNRPELYWAMAAAQALGGVPIPIYPDSDHDEVLQLLERSEAPFVVAEDQEQVDKMLAARPQSGFLEQVIYKNPRGLRKYTDENLHAWTEVQALGETFGQSNPDYYSDQLTTNSGDDAAVILYTSGSTGEAKGVVHNHRGLIQTALNAALSERYRTDEKGFAYLPPAWVGDFMLSYAVPMVVGYCVHIPEDSATMLTDMREVAPTVYLAPPFVYEVLLSRASIKMLDAGKRNRAIYHYFMDLAERVGPRIANGTPVALTDRLMYALGNILVYGPVKNVLGLSDLRTAYTAGESMSPRAFNFYRAMGVNIKQLYGQTESALYVCAHGHQEAHPAWVGRPVEGVEVRIQEDGEILYRSPGVFREYYKDPQTTSQVKTDDGWVHSGDYGTSNAAGDIRIIDRMTNLESFQNGKQFAPRYLEGRIKESFYIREAITFAAEGGGTIAIINVDPESIGDWAERKSLTYTGYQELAGHSEVYDLLQAEIERLNIELARENPDLQIRRFVVLHKLMTSRGGEITRTSKLRRHFIRDHYDALVEALNSTATNFVHDEGHQSFVLKLREVAWV
ncbi:MAG: AMP-binding protein [Motiliproteus sp.]